VSNWVEVPLKFSISHLSNLGARLTEIFAGSLVSDGSVTVHLPLLSEVELLLMVDDGDAFLLSEDHVVGGLVGLLKMEPEVSVGLHGGGSWLSVLVGIVAVVVCHLGSLGNSVAFHNLNLEIDVRVKGNWLSTEWGLGVGTTP